jgi:hypothetical protein
MKPHKYKKNMEQCLGWGEGVSIIMASWGNGGTYMKRGTSIVLKQQSTDCLSISGPLRSCIAVFSVHNFYVVMCLVAILLPAFFSNFATCLTNGTLQVK